ncbi:MAG TPA: NUDIX domain-containing protein, partial [Chitinophagaceae bacterium]
MPVLCVDVLILHEGKCLLLLRDNEPAKGTYWFPGGRVHKNETLRNAALRKAKEETNLDCTFSRIISVEESLFDATESMHTDVHTVNVCCVLEAPDISGLRPDHLHKEYIWADSVAGEYHPAVANPLVLLGLPY